MMFALADRGYFFCLCESAEISRQKDWLSCCCNTPSKKTNKAPCVLTLKYYYNSNTGRSLRSGQRWHQPGRMAGSPAEARNPLTYILRPRVMLLLLTQAPLYSPPMYCYNKDLLCFSVGQGFFSLLLPPRWSSIGSSVLLPCPLGKVHLCLCSICFSLTQTRCSLGASACTCILQSLSSVSHDIVWCWHDV